MYKLMEIVIENNLIILVSWNDDMHKIQNKNKSLLVAILTIDKDLGNPIMSYLGTKSRFISWIHFYIFTMTTSMIYNNSDEII